MESINPINRTAFKANDPIYLSFYMKMMVVSYGISIFVSFLMQNPVHTHVSNIYDLLTNSLSATIFKRESFIFTHTHTHTVKWFQVLLFNVSNSI